MLPGCSPLRNRRKDPTGGKHALHGTVLLCIILNLEKADMAAWSLPGGSYRGVPAWSTDPSAPQQFLLDMQQQVRDGKDLCLSENSFPGKCECGFEASCEHSVGMGNMWGLVTTAIGVKEGRGSGSWPRVCTVDMSVDLPIRR